MAGIVFACRLLLALVFAVAGIAKLADREGARAAAAEFGLGWRLAGPVSFVVPVLELGVAVALLPGVSAPWAAAAAAGLLVAFVLAIGVNLARGRRPDCHCFGQLHSAPAGPAALGRNVVLGAVAGLVAVAGFRDPGPSAVGWLSGVGAVVIAGFAVGAVVVALLGWLAYALLRQQGRLLIRLDTLEATLAAHGIEVPSAGELEEPGLAVGRVRRCWPISGAGSASMRRI